MNRPTMTPTLHRRRIGRQLLVAALLACAAAAQANAPVDDTACAGGPTADAVTAQRERFNAAIRNKDIDTIDEILADEVVLVTGTDSDVYTGRVRQLALWARDFESEERLIYVRTPSCIELSGDFGLALEHGRWRGAPETDAAPDRTADGRYTAKWRRTEGIWRLEAEVYMTDTCGRLICPPTEEAR